MPPSSVDARIETPQSAVPGARFLPVAVERALCILVVAIMVIAAIYAAWIAITNFSRIGV
jgi:hypothetical protein